MPGHKTHDRIAWILTPVCIYTATTWYTTFWYALYIGASFLLASYFLSPDLDLDSAIYKRWGFFRFYWYPYKKLVKHRSWISHSGPISGTLRFLYVLPLLFWLTYFGGYDILVCIYIGIVLADCIHTLSDIVA